MLELKIEKNPYNGGLYCFFKHKKQEYYADLCVVSFASYTECMIFAAKDGQVTSWSDLYCRRNVAVTEDSMRNCVEEFIEELEREK